MSKKNKGGKRKSPSSSSSSSSSSDNEHKLSKKELKRQKKLGKKKSKMFGELTYLEISELVANAIAFDIERSRSIYQEKYQKDAPDLVTIEKWKENFQEELIVFPSELRKRKVDSEDAIPEVINLVEDGSLVIQPKVAKLNEHGLLKTLNPDSSHTAKNVLTPQSNVAQYIPAFGFGGNVIPGTGYVAGIPNLNSPQISAPYQPGMVYPPQAPIYYHTQFPIGYPFQHPMSYPGHPGVIFPSVPLAPASSLNQPTTAATYPANVPYVPGQYYAPVLPLGPNHLPGGQI